MDIKDKLKPLFEKLNKFLQGKKSGGFFQKLLISIENIPSYREISSRLTGWKIFLALVAGMLSADFILQGVISLMPTSKNKQVTQAPTQAPKPLLSSKARYEAIVRRNAFCPNCPVPIVDLKKAQKPKDCHKSTPYQGSVKLIGTIVLSRPEYSVAIIQDGSAESKAIRLGDNLASVGKVFEIKKNKICFEKLDGKMTTLETPEEPIIRFGQPVAGALPADPNEGIVQKNEGEVEIKKSYLIQKLEDPEVLSQAYAVPVKGNDGKIRCFKIMSIVPGSVYEKLGMKVDDCISGVNGEPLNSIAKVQQLYATIRNVDEVNMEIDRGGSTQTLTFRVK